MTITLRPAIVTLALLAGAVCACGDDDGSEAVRSGVGDSCVDTNDCEMNDQECLTEFKGGYCGRRDCTADEDCPNGSACVTVSGTNYCFLVCRDKPECNQRRPVDDEANCSSSVTFVEGAQGRKACLPPSGT